MAKLNNVDIPIALSNHTKLDLSCDHDTTMDFLKVQPVCYRHCIKGEHLNFDALATVRPAPMSIPTYGRMRLNLRGFYVPYFTVFQKWDEYFEDVIASDGSSSSLVQSVPYTTNSDLVYFFLTQAVGVYIYVDEITDASIIAAGAYDFILDGTNYFRFKPIARPWIKILKSLGYRINWNTKDKTPISMLALLCYAKVYLDWYANSQYLDSASVLRLEQLLNYNDPVTPLCISSAADFAYLLGLITSVVYDDNSYFVNAWDNPVAPSLNQITPIGRFTDISDPSPSVSVSVSSFPNGTPYMEQTDMSDTSVGTQYIHDALKKLTNLVKRRQLSGSRAIDRYLAQFGAATESTKIRRCIYVGSQTIDINVAEQMSTANTAAPGQPSTLADYAGKGFGQGSKSWDFVADNFGMFIVTASILPSSGYFQGMDRHNMHLSKFDFFTPELDSLGVQAIQKREVYISPNGNFGTGLQYDAAFGFTGRYGEYKRPINFVSGDIDLKSVMIAGDAWHLNRVLNDDMFQSGGATSILGLTHSLDFSRGVDGYNFDRIFNYVGDDLDHFFCHFHFDMGSYCPCKPLFETYDFDESSKKVTLTSNGTKLN